MALLRQQLEDASGGLLDELEAGRVVGERDVREDNLLYAVLEETKAGLDACHCKILFVKLKALHCMVEL